MKVVILYDGVATDWTEEEIASVMRPVNEIGRILAGQGHSVSRVGVRHDLRWLARARQADLVVNLCEGINGVGRYEDLVTATLELAGIPFTGARSWTITVCHHKGLVNALLQSAGVPIPRWIVPRGHRIPPDFPLPAIVKPAAEDASVGIEQASVVATRPALEDRLARLSETFDEILVQEFVAGREFAVGFVGDVILPVSEIDFSRMPDGAWHILSFQGKWEKGHAEDVGSRPICPAQIEPALTQRIVATAREAWRTVRGCGYGRVDLRVDHAGYPWILEVNPNPDISDDAGLSAMAHANGWSYADLILQMVRSAQPVVRARQPADRPAGGAPPRASRSTDPAPA